MSYFAVIYYDFDSNVYTCTYNFVMLSLYVSSYMEFSNEWHEVCLLSGKKA